MKLVLAHGIKYGYFYKHGERFDIKNSITIDIDPDVLPHIILDLSKERFPFLDNTVDEIIDAGGMAGECVYYKSSLFWSEIERVLKKDCLFFGRYSKNSKNLETYNLKIVNSPNKNASMFFTLKKI